MIIFHFFFMIIFHFLLCYITFPKIPVFLFLSLFLWGPLLFAFLVFFSSLQEFILLRELSDFSIQFLSPFWDSLTPNSFFLSLSNPSNSLTHFNSRSSCLSFFVAHYHFIPSDEDSAKWGLFLVVTLCFLSFFSLCLFFSFLFSSHSPPYPFWGLFTAFLWAFDFDVFGACFEFWEHGFRWERKWGSWHAHLGQNDDGSWRKRRRRKGEYGGYAQKWKLHYFDWGWRRRRGKENRIGSPVYTERTARER